MDGNGFSDPYVKLFLLPGNRIVSKITISANDNSNIGYD